MSESADETIIEIRKNDVERLRLQRSTYRGRRLLSLRVFALQQDGSWSPLKKGITLRPPTWKELLPHIEAALEAEAS